ncbi:3-phosphoshikimate 1-carboxyvinyltransferase [Actinomyces sp. oral taxon 414]|uniref:3-phosphoshikimate 1-carboxyvinyltransferase n=1 Tax=Actinomyces sp. oral taxon 414 TaxID=712122 RepID=UPI0006AE1A67|nr:3-phosphoshikimate 1-carboxyvinyltransferase [Actinomyces sp. oral taxon 414]ALD00706.1 3-phosphoshikimate 1-carboxyvinyltransferase [Actinomyces sp. oral taxon 414]
MPGGPLDAVVDLPGSKSLTARALLLAAVAQGPTTLTGVLRARDTELMLAALTALGARFEEIGADPTRLRVVPAPLPLHVEAGDGGAGRVDVGLAGTVMRFVPPLAALADAPVLFDGDAAARARPLGPLLDALASLGAEVVHLGEPGHLPVRVGPGDGALSRPATPAAAPDRGLPPHRVSVDASGSSQFLSALLLLGPLLPGGLAVTPTGRVPSLPHVAMTVAALRERGVDVVEPDPAAPAGRRTWTVRPGRPAGGAAAIEPDLSNAGPFLAAALIAGGRVRVPRWPGATTQGGDAWRGLLARLGADVELRAGADGAGALVVRAAGAGALRGIDADLSAVGELAPVLAALAVVTSAHGRSSRLTGIAHLRGHETDRLAALVAEITRIGGLARQTRDGIEIGALPAGGRLRPALLRAYADHRMATFAAVVGLAVPGIRLDDVGCTSKTLPDFPDLWADAVGTGPAAGAEGRS